MLCNMSTSDGQVNTAMATVNATRPSQVIGPTGEPITLDTLPPSDTERWVIRRKAEVVAAVRGGLLTLEEACKRYTLSVEEFLSWQRAIDRNGLAGLRVTRSQQYRRQRGIGETRHA